MSALGPTHYRATPAKYGNSKITVVAWQDTDDVNVGFTHHGVHGSIILSREQLIMHRDAIDEVLIAIEQLQEELRS